MINMKAYLQAAFGDRLAFSYSFSSFLVRSPGAKAFNALTLSQYVLKALHPNTNDLQISTSSVSLQKIIAFASIIMIIILNCFRIKVISKVMNTLAALKLLLVAFLTCAAIYAISKSTEVLKENFAAPFRGSWTALGPAMVAVMWSCGGYGNIAFMVEEMHNPRLDVGPAIILTCFTVTVLIFSCLLSYFAILPVSVIQSSSAVAMDATRGVAGVQGATIVALLIAISVLGTNFGGMMTVSRLLWATARDGKFPSFLTKMSRNGVPYMTVLTYGFWCLILTSLPGTTLSSLLMFIGTIDWTFDGLVAASLLRLRYLMPIADRAFRVPLYPLPPLVLMTVGSFMVINSIIIHPISACIGLAFILGAFPIHYLFVTAKPNNVNAGQSEDRRALLTEES